MPARHRARSCTITACPRAAAVAAVRRPAGPAPITITVPGVSACASVPSPSVASRPVAGVSTHATCSERSALPDADVRADAASGLVRPAGPRLAHEMWVSEVRARHPDDIGRTVGDRAGGHAEIDDAARDEDGGAVADELTSRARTASIG